MILTNYPSLRLDSVVYANLTGEVALLLENEGCRCDVSVHAGV